MRSKSKRLFPTAGGPTSRREVLRQGAALAAVSVIAPMWTRIARAQSASTFDYYISPTGSDSNPGTLAAPWSITAINSKGSIYAGKTVGILSGTYNVYALCQAGAWNAPALQVRGGTAASPTVIAAVNPRQAILTAANPANGAYPTTECGIIGQAYTEPAPGNVVIDGLYLTRSHQFGVAFKPPQTASEGGATGYVVRNCEIYDIQGLEGDNECGILIYYSTGALIQNNFIHGVQLVPGSPIGHNCAGILSFNCKSNVYEYNTISDCQTGIYDKNPSNGNHTYRYNYIECLGYGPLVDCSGGSVGDVVTVHHNILIGPQTWDGSDMNVTSYQGLAFYNNTCYSGSGAFKPGGLYYPARGAAVSPGAVVHHYNNVYYSSNSPGYLADATFCSGSIALSDYNCYQAGTAVLGTCSTGGTNVTTFLLADWQSNFRQDVHSTAGNPQFQNPTSMNPSGYQLQSGSLGRGTGRQGGTSSGAPCNMGAWDGVVTQIGCSFAPGATGGSTALPDAPALTVS